MICHRLMQARAILLEIVPNSGIPYAVPVFPDPSKAPGIDCIGSRCALWYRRMNRQGRCGDNPDGPFFDVPAMPTEDEKAK